jgi:hypothetical protein
MQTQKITPEIVAEIKGFLSQGGSIAAASREFGFSPTAISYRLRRRPQDSDEDYDPNVTEEDFVHYERRKALGPALAGWSYPDARWEAAFLLNISDRNGGRDAMRRLIEVTPEQQKALWRLVAAGQLPHHRVAGAIRFRGAVLEHFDALTRARH